MKDLVNQLKKQKNKEIINFKSIMFSEYHDFLNVFFKKKVDVLSSHKKHDRRIKLKKEKIHKYAFLCNMSKKKLLLIKKYLQKHLNKECIKSNIAFYASFILFAKKFDEELRFCVKYRKLNAIIKKNKYSILLIAETIARLFKIK
jgi:hypothetical protein